MKFEANKEFIKKFLLTLPWSFDNLFTSGSLLHDYNTEFALNLRHHIKSRTTLKQFKNILPMHALLELSKFERRSFHVSNFNSYLNLLRSTQK